MIVPLTYGGKQEGELSPGTENLPGICGFGLAADLALYRMREDLTYVQGLWDYCTALLQKRIPEVKINSPISGSPYILNISIPGKTSEQLVGKLSRKEIYVSAGSACSRGEPSHVLTAMGYSEERIKSALRISFSRDTKREDIEELIESLG